MNIMTALHGGLGVAVIVGGVQRFSPPTYSPLVDLVDGHTWVWGVWIMASAGLMMVPHRWPQMIGLWVGMLWHWLWCVMFAKAVVLYPDAGATAGLAYGAFAMICAALLVERVSVVLAGWSATHPHAPTGP
jgi:hypothetical protein